jgi:RNA polymerase sigma factor (sigma-70 family)
MLEKLAVHHELWIKMLLNLGCDIYVAKDLVQDMYLRMHRLVKDEKRIMYKDDINRYFVWITLRNLYYSYLKDERKRNSIFYEILENDEVVENKYNVEEDSAFEKIMNKVNEVISDWTVYDKRLFELYFLQGLSLRAISKGAKIGLTSIHNSILNQKAILKEYLSEDLIDYFNQDFDNI